MDHVTREQVKPLAPTPPTTPEPYRVLFPVGIAAAFVALLPWLAQALSGAPWWPEALRPMWPGPAHAAIMMQGFELAFVAGFLLTAMPAFTHGPRATRFELALATLGPDWWKRLGAYGSYHIPGGANVAFADGSARYLSGATPPSTMYLLSTRNGGEPVPDLKDRKSTRLNSSHRT